MDLKVKRPGLLPQEIKLNILAFCSSLDIDKGSSNCELKLSLVKTPTTDRNEFLELNIYRDLVKAKRERVIRKTYFGFPKCF